MENITPEIQALLDAQKAELTTKFEQDSAGLLKAKNDLLGEKKAATAEAERIKMEKAAQNKDVATLSESYEQKLKAERDTLQAVRDENAKLLGSIKQAEIGKISNAFVSENCVDDPFIREAMNNAYSSRVDIREGKPVILDPEGNLTALSLDDLQNEFKTASKYKNHIKVSNSTGGGANGSRQTTAGAGVTANISGSTTAEKSAALALKIPALANLPIR